MGISYLGGVHRSSRTFIGAFFVLTTMAFRANRNNREQNSGKKNKWRRIIGLAIAVPPVAILAVCLILAYQIYTSNRVMAQHSRFPVMAAPTPPQSLLIFSPHCDDETLGAGGLIYHATHHGCPVHVVFFTNGDGFRIGVSQEFAKISVKPTDFVRYGYLRQQETRTALKLLGVPASNITFLGYPDRGLMPMLTTNWDPSHSFRSAYTQYDYSPYNDANTPDTPYCGQAALRDVEAQLQRIRPTDIFVTHPNDDHPDHAAASVFVRAALEQLRAAGEPWAKNARLHYYLVHRGDWPVPQGLHEDAALPPPAQLVNTGTQWEQLPLSRREIQHKYAAIKRYKSQTELTGRFLFSFARENELFGTVDADTDPVLPRASAHRGLLSAASTSWVGLRPVALDPAGDSIGRMMQAGADITGMYAARQGENLVVRADMAGKIEKGVRYCVTLRPLLIGPHQPAVTNLSFTAGDQHVNVPVDGLPGAAASWMDNSIAITLPWKALGIPDGAAGDLYIQADTRLADVAVDRTGFRAIPLSPPKGPQTASVSAE